MLLLSALLLVMTTQVFGHGRLWEPPGRSTMWRRNFNTPINYDDNQLFCGGFVHQVSLGYKCGVCGDPYDGARLNEEGGLYATGNISRNYLQGQVVTVQVEVTANHKGYFEFKICPKSSIGEKTTQECLDRYLLTLADGSGTKRMLASTEYGIINVPVLLPSALTCKYCVLQWRYHTGNSWGVDPDGTQCVGCGYQEEFYGCADVSIGPHEVESSHAENNQSADKGPKAVTATTTTSGRVTTASTTRSTSKTVTCKAAGAYVGVAGMDAWCAVNCAAGYCPATNCVCN